jgi:hypothetical protein
MFHTFSIEFASSYPPSLEAVAEEMEEAGARDQCLQQLALAALRSAADGGGEGVDLSGQLFHHYSLHVVHQIHLNALLRETYRVDFMFDTSASPLPSRTATAAGATRPGGSTAATSPRSSPPSSTPSPGPSGQPAFL